MRDSLRGPVQRSPLAALSALSPIRDDCASAGGCRAASKAVFLLMKPKTEEVQPACSHAEFPWYVPKRRLLIPLTWLDFNQCRNTLPMQVALIVLFGCSRGSRPFFIFCMRFVNGVCRRSFCLGNHTCSIPSRLQCPPSTMPWFVSTIT